MKNDVANINFFTANETANKELLEILLFKLVRATESATIASLEKTYFNINGLIQRSRKNENKTALIEVRLSCFLPSIKGEMMAQ